MAFSERGLIEHLNGSGWLKEPERKRLGSIIQKPELYIPDSSRCVLVNGFRDHTILHVFRNVENGQSHRTGDEDRGISQMQTY